MPRTIAKLYEHRLRRGREIVLDHWLGEGHDLPARDPEFKRQIQGSLLRLGVKLPKPDIHELLCGEIHRFSPTRWVLIRYFTVKL